VVGDRDLVVERGEVAARQKAILEGELLALRAAHQLVGSEDRDDDRRPGGPVPQHEIGPRVVVDGPLSAVR
jgi:hypothetical protein